MRAARLGLALLLLVLAGCSSALRFEQDPPGVHTVRRGDTLYSIAFRNQLDWKELASWNGIGPPYTISVGQKLKLVAPPSTASAPRGGGKTPSRPRPAPKQPSAPPPTRGWAWPSDGAIVARFRAGVASAKGIDIAGKLGDAVRAAGDGRVVYVGSGLIGYGKVIIVKHDDRYLSAYAHNDSFLVAEGDAVTRGQRIATMGLGPGQRPLLHFEIRLDGRAVDPLPLLPRR
jgi:lipoprotein NlpD